MGVTNRRNTVPRRRPGGHHIRRRHPLTQATSTAIRSCRIHIIDAYVLGPETAQPTFLFVDPTTPKHRLHRADQPGSCTVQRPARQLAEGEFRIISDCTVK